MENQLTSLEKKIDELLASMDEPNQAHQNPNEKLSEAGSNTRETPKQ